MLPLFLTKLTTTIAVVNTQQRYLERDKSPFLQ